MTSAFGGRIHQALEKARKDRDRTISEVQVTPPTGLQNAGTGSANQATFVAPEVTISRKQGAQNHVLLDDDMILSNSIAVAAYRMLRTRMGHRIRTNKWTTIGVTSPGAGDGKSITALNLALAIAREKTKDVVLIDLDMRSPTICRYLGVTPPTEVNEFFEESASAEDVLFSMGIENLVLAGTRSVSEHSSELLATGRISELFDFVKQQFKDPIILVDLPPILTADDALVMGQFLDAFLLVLGEGRSRRDSTAKAIEILDDFDIAGVVLNRSTSLVADPYNTY